MHKGFSVRDQASRILVVDDMAMSRATAKKMLNELGFMDVSVAADGEEAWNQLFEADKAQKPFVLVVTDWMMPILDGMGLLRKIKKSGWSFFPAILLATAESDSAQVSQAVKEGISGYVRKPLTRPDLLAALNRVHDSVQKAQTGLDRG